MPNPLIDAVTKHPIYNSLIVLLVFTCVYIGVGLDAPYKQKALQQDEEIREFKQQIVEAGMEQATLKRDYDKLVIINQNTRQQLEKWTKYRSEMYHCDVAFKRILSGDFTNLTKGFSMFGTKQLNVKATTTCLSLIDNASIEIHLIDSQTDEVVDKATVQNLRAGQAQTSVLNVLKSFDADLKVDELIKKIAQQAYTIKVYHKFDVAESESDPADIVE